MTNRATRLLAGLALQACATGCFFQGKSPTPDAGTVIDAGPPLAGQGAVVLPNGAQGIAVVHFEDMKGQLLNPPISFNLPGSGTVTQLAEPPDFSEGMAADGVGLQALEAANAQAALDDRIQVGAYGTTLSMAVLPGTSFSAVQFSGQSAFTITCFTGGLHLAQGQPMTPGTPIAKVLSASPDGQFLLAWNTSGAFQLNRVVPSQTAHAISIVPMANLPGVTPPVVTGRGAMAWHPTEDVALVGGPDGSLSAISRARTQPAIQSIQLTGSPAVASVAFAPSGAFAVAATTSGLFTVGVDPDGGAPTVRAGPTDPTFTGADGQTYKLDHAQSVAFSSDGALLIALVDQPSASAGTLVALPIDAEGTLGPAGSTLGGVLAATGVDALYAH